jgi:dUTP pyrophosphatase
MYTRVNVKLTSSGKLPQYQTAGSSGVDLHADVAEPVTVKAGQRLMVSSGVALEMPSGLEAQVRPRSGLALKKGITVLNSPGSIDSDFRDTVQVILFNSSNEDFVVNPGDRIAQLVFTPVVRVTFVKTEVLSDTERGLKGFGSSGV